MTDEEVRLECLRLALGADSHQHDAVARARAYADFVLGTKDGEIVQAAEDLAAKVNQA